MKVVSGATEMKLSINLCGVLAVLCLNTALGQDPKLELSTTAQRGTAQTLNVDTLSAATREKLTKTVLTPKSPDKIVGERFVFSGPLVTLAKSDGRLRAFNPFSTSSTAGGSQLEAGRIDPYLPPPRGITLFRLSF